MVLGAEGSGTIVALGDAVRGLQLGDAVYGYAYGDAKGGFYAEYVALAGGHVAPFPRRSTSAKPAASASPGVTALAGIETRSACAPGRRLISRRERRRRHVAVQFAKQRGARVSRPRKAARARVSARPGRRRALDTQHDDVLDVVRRFAPAASTRCLRSPAGPRSNARGGAARRRNDRVSQRRRVPPDAARRSRSTAFRIPPRSRG